MSNPYNGKWDGRYKNYEDFEKAYRQDDKAVKNVTNDEFLKLLDDLLSVSPPEKNCKANGTQVLDGLNDLNSIYDNIFESSLDDQTSKKLEPHPLKDPPKTLVVNLFAGPGAGKSTMAAGLFYELKSRGINCELASEFVKDLVWEERHKTIEDQIYIFGKQYHRISRLMGQVDVIIVDSPLLLTIIYDKERRESLRQLVLEEHRKMWTYNVCLVRSKPFNPKGRLHDVSQASQLDLDILYMLDDCEVCYETFMGNPQGKDAILEKIVNILEYNRGF